MTTEAEFKSIFFDLADAFPEFKPASPQATLSLYSRMLKDVPTEALRIAADEWMIGERWFPKIAELREKASTGKAGHWRTHAPAASQVDYVEYDWACRITPRGWMRFRVTGKQPPALSPDEKRMDELSMKDPEEYTPADCEDYKRIDGNNPWWLIQ